MNDSPDGMGGLKYSSRGSLSSRIKSSRCYIVYGFSRNGNFFFLGTGVLRLSFDPRHVILSVLI